ncbi:MAG: methyltransferase domain-containing protein [Cyanosarcina radialis HA8281-LM2]|nr:methyltransferase domain-containing protein [Cyanosarcina radialis HA8281-LM2]
MSREQTLETQRQLASLASCGISNEPIYQVFDRVIKQYDLTGDLLDFGAGTGNLAQRLQSARRFRSITAIDLMPRPPEIDPAISWLTADLNHPLDLPAATFDVIVSAEVIEHLENPRAVAREWCRLLRPEGTLVFSTPNNESWRALLALLLQGHFVFFGDSCYPAHITALLSKDIERILPEAGFSIPTFVFSDVGGIPKLPRFQWQTISAGLLKGRRYSDNLIAIARKIKSP